MKKELTVALLGVSIALGSSGVGNAVSAALTAPRPAGPPNAASLLQLANLSASDLTEIRRCVADSDVLCLRNLLAAKPHLLQCAIAPFDPALTSWEIRICQALLNFWIASDGVTTRDIFGEVEVAMSATPAIYA